MHINVINFYRVLEDLNLDGMVYASRAGLNTTKQCLDGTRGEILWRLSTGSMTRTSMHRGSSGFMARQGEENLPSPTRSLWFKNVGGLGSCFCFACDRQAECREEKMFTTISCELVDHDPAFRHAFASVFTNNSSLMATPDIIQQWENFCPGTIVSGVNWGNRKYSCGY